MLLPMLLVGCKETTSYNNVALDRYTLELRAGDTQSVYVVAGDPDNVLWQSDDEFVATVDGGAISALRIGRTRITANNAAVSVTVVGRSNLYDEPMEGLEWQMTREQVVDKLGLPDEMADGVLTYNLSSSVNSFVRYTFTGNRLVEAAITVSRTATSQLDDFLGERYLLLDDSDSRQDKDYIDRLTYDEATMVVTRTGFDNDYWIVTYKPLK